MAKPAAIQSPPPAAEVLGRLRHKDGAAMTEQDQFKYACDYLDAGEATAVGLVEYVDRVNRVRRGDATFTHDARLEAFVRHCAALPEPLSFDHEARLVLIGAYIDHRVAVDATGVGDFVPWLFDALGLDMPADFVVAPPTESGFTPAEEARILAARDKVNAEKAAREAEKAAKKAEKAARARAKVANPCGEVVLPRMDNAPLPGQQDLPFAANGEAYAGADGVPEAAPGKKSRKAGMPNWTGKRIKYRSGKAWVVGNVVDGAGPTLAFVDEAGERWSNVDRTLCKVIKPMVKAADLDADEEVEAAPAPPPAPPIVVVVPARDQAKFKKLLADPKSVVKGVDPGCCVAAYSVDIDDYRVCVEFTNGDRAGGYGCYTDIYVLPLAEAIAADQTGDYPLPTFELPPAQTLVGTYEVMFGDAKRYLEVQAVDA